MCGVIGLVCARERDDMGQVAAGLLQTLEYHAFEHTWCNYAESGGQKNPFMDA